LRRREGMSVEARVKEMVAALLGLDVGEITPESNLIENLGADSLDLIELLMDIEDKYNLEVPDADVEKLLTVGGLVAYVQEHMK
jgi:acyl carrier protein